MRTLTPALASILVLTAACGSKDDGPAVPAGLGPIARDVGNSLLDPGARDIAMPAYTPALESQVPSDLLLVRAQPAVLRIESYGDAEITLPAQAVLDDAALKSEWEKQGGGTEAARVRFHWARIAEDTERYLKVSSELKVTQQKDVPISSGTGFLVSREGIVVTNAHVVSDFVAGPVSADPQVMKSVLGEYATQRVQQIRALIGGDPEPAQVPTVASAILLWTRNHSLVAGRFTSARLVLQVTRKRMTMKEIIATSSVAEALSRPPSPIAAPMEVLAKGEPIPGKDVAILRVRAGDWDPVNRSICLALGSSDEVLPGARVQAMGFPGVGYDPKVMAPEAEYRVSAQDGQIGNTKPMTGGWDAFEMTANINHGDSGGPVLDASGRVIALNVAGSAAGHTLAVPIALAQRMLKDLKIVPDPGPTTALWIEALSAYGRGDYKAADAKLDALVEIESGDRTDDGKSSVLGAQIKLMPSEKVNPYVLEMRGRVFSKTHK